MRRRVLIALSHDGLTGPRPASGVVECDPLRRRPDSEGPGVVLPAGVRAELASGQVVVELEADWVWRIIETPVGGATRHVLVPAGDPQVVLHYRDLPDVDPATLEPGAEPEAAWWVALSQVQAGTVDPAAVAAAVDEALDGRLSSGGSTHLGQGAPPDLIVGARVGDIYIDTVSGTIYRLGE